MQKQTYNFRKWAVMAVIGASLAGCGDTPVQQALMGAGAGVAVSTVANKNATTGAFLGAVASVAYCQTYPTRC